MTKQLWTTKKVNWDWKEVDLKKKEKLLGTHSFKGKMNQKRVLKC